MLYLTRKQGQSIVIGTDIKVTVLEIKKSGVKLGFEGPPSVTVLRQEVFDMVKQENQQAGDAALMKEVWENINNEE